jgi:hypothetical protein
MSERGQVRQSVISELSALQIVAASRKPRSGIASIAARANAIESRLPAATHRRGMSCRTS